MDLNKPFAYQYGLIKNSVFSQNLLKLSLSSLLLSFYVALRAETNPEWVHNRFDLSYSIISFSFKGPPVFDGIYFNGVYFPTLSLIEYETMSYRNV